MNVQALFCMRAKNASLCDSKISGRGCLQAPRRGIAAQLNIPAESARPRARFETSPSAPRTRERAAKRRHFASETDGAAWGKAGRSRDARTWSKSRTAPQKGVDGVRCPAQKSASPCGIPRWRIRHGFPEGGAMGVPDVARRRNSQAPPRYQKTPRTAQGWRSRQKWPGSPKMAKAPEAGNLDTGANSAGESATQLRPTRYPKGAQASEGPIGRYGAILRLTQMISILARRNPSPLGACARKP